MPKPESQEEVARQLVAQTLPGVSVEVLQELHLLTREGRLNADSRRKLKQVAHFLGFLRAPLQDIAARHAELVVVDCAAGKAYLGLLLAQALLAPLARARLFAVESRAELSNATSERAARFGIGSLRAIHAEIAEATLPPRIHMVTALHACDTATDDALALAIRRDADYVAVVPCCQAEVARQLERHSPPDPALASLAGHAWHRRELGSHLTNVIRVLALEAHGYKVTVTELAGWEHSLKNELILGKRVQRHDARAARELEGLLGATGVQPKLVRLLEAPEPA